MTRLGDEMIHELAASLGSSLTKTAAEKKDEDDKEEKEEKKKEKEEKAKEDKKEEKAKKDDKKDKAEKKKKEAVMYVLNGLSKLAEDLDGIGADDASGLVDDALRIIVYNLEAETGKKS